MLLGLAVIDRLDNQPVANLGEAVGFSGIQLESLLGGPLRGPKPLGLGHFAHGEITCSCRASSRNP